MGFAILGSERLRAFIDRVGACAYLVGCAAFLPCGSAWALSTEGSLRDLKHTSFGPKEGAPSAIDAIAQTKDGFLWLGAQSGLYRFDGERFEHVQLQAEKPLPGAAYSLLAPGSGGLWIGFQLGGAAFLKDGRVTVYGESEGLPPGTVKCFAEDQQGRLWAATTTGLARLEGKRWHKVGSEEGFTDNQASSTFVDSAGTLWVSSKNKVLYLPKGERQFRDTGIVPGPEEGGHFAESPGGEFVFEDGGDVVFAFKQPDAGGRPLTGYGGSPLLIFDRDGALWTATKGGRRVRIPHAAATLSSNQLENYPDSLSEEDGLTEGKGLGAFEDRDGNVWFVSETGLDRFSERNVARILPFPRKDNPFMSMASGIAAADGGEVWLNSRVEIGSLFPLSRFDGHNLFPTEIGGVSCSVRLENGTLWFGGPDGLWKYAEGHFDKYPLPQGSDQFDVQAMAQDRKGELWVSIVRRGVFHQTGKGWSAYGALPDLPKLTAVALAADARERIWFGYTDGRIALLDGNKVTVFGDPQPLSIGTVKAIYGQRSRVWIGGDLGLAFYDGSGIKALHSTVEGRFSNITGIVETKNGDLWVNTSPGMVHVTAEELQHALTQPDYAVRGELFDASDGVEGDSAKLRPLPTAIEGTDGRLWFMRSIGLYLIRPDHIFRQTRPPAIVLESLHTDKSSYPPTRGLRLPANTRSLHIDYVGVNLTTPEKVRYRYKLEGVDPDWQDGQARRQAFYTNLGPGHHRFHVTASNDDGVWTTPEATLDFEIEPTFVQTGWFFALCGALAVLAGWLVLRLRIQQVSTSLRVRLQERMDERERIARELHDTLLQGTQALVLNVEGAAKHVDKGMVAYRMLQEALNRADRIIAEGRDRIQDLRLPTDPSNDLGKAFAALGEELSKLYPTDFKVVLEGGERTLRPIVREEAYWIGREALINAFRHARANSIEVQIIYADEALRIRIRDDGQGLDESAIQSRGRLDHWGLSGMRERAAKIGAKLEIWSHPNAGTEIELYVPVESAYAGRRSFTGWLSLILRA